MKAELRTGDRVTVARESIERGVVRAQSFSSGYHFVDLDSGDAVVIFLRDENKTWCRGHLNPDEARAIFVAEALA